MYESLTPGLHALGAMPRSELVPLIAVPAYFFSFFFYFCFRSIWVPVPRSARFDKMGRAKVVPRFVLEYGYWMLNSQVKILLALGLSADAMTLLSLAFGALGAMYIGVGRFGLGGWLMFYSFFCDAFDGIIARKRGTASNRGEYFDAFVDRYADMITGFGFLYYYRNDAWPAAIVAMGMAGSAAMGYARAKGEAVGIDPNVGVMQRHERAAWIGVFTVLSPFVSAFVEPGASHPMFHLALFALLLVAILSNVSAVWRALYVLRRMPKPVAPAPRPSGSGEPRPAPRPVPLAKPELSSGTVHP
jgi:CDP-diacylglycerol--glycerol-3-phosphate 3-phosphatidyltransferase